MRAAQQRERDQLVGRLGTEDSATTVAQRRTARVPSSVSASRRVSILRGSAKKAELTWRSSAIERPTSAPMIRSSSSKEASGAGQLASACSEASAPAAALAARAGEELALEVEKPSTRQRVNSSASRRRWPRARARARRARRSARAAPRRRGRDARP